jgi:hypothetical protein
VFWRAAEEFRETVQSSLVMIKIAGLFGVRKKVREVLNFPLFSGNKRAITMTDGGAR